MEILLDNIIESLAPSVEFEKISKSFGNGIGSFFEPEEVVWVDGTVLS